MSAGTAFERVTAALVAHGAQPPRTANGPWCCPAHDDRTPSLSVTAGADRVLLKCQAGCATGAVVEALGLTLADLFDEERARPDRPRIVATYDYTDESGALLYEVVRFDPKGFRQRRPDGRGGRIWNLQGIERVPYRLPEVIAAVDEGRRVFIAEGEKDVEALRRAGEVATSNAAGAGKWDPRWARYFIGADVVIAADTDLPGYRHAKDVRDSLAPVAKAVTVVQAAVGKDAADHLGAGRTVAEFVQITAELDQLAGVEPAPNAGNAGNAGKDGDESYHHDDGPEEPLDTSWDPIDLGPAWRGEKTRPEAHVFCRPDGLSLLPPALNYLFGDSGDGKSWVLLLAALSEARDGHQVVWVSYEDANEDLLVERLRLLGATDDEVGLIRFLVPQESLTAGAEHLVEMVNTSGARLLVLDSVGEAMAVGGVNEDKDAEVGPWFRATLRYLHDRCPGLAVAPIDHSTKSKDNPLFPSGSKRKRSAPTGRAYLLNVRQPLAKDAVGWVQLIVAKDRHGDFKRGAVAAEIKLDATVRPYEWEIRAPADGAEYNPGQAKRNAAERVREVLGESAVGLTAEQVTRIANGVDRKRPGEADLTIKTVKNALATLAKGPEVAQVPPEVRPEVRPDRVPTAPALWIVNRPDRVPTPESHNG